MAAPANLVKVDNSRVAATRLSYAQRPLRSEWEFEKYTMKNQTYLQVDMVGNRLGGVVVQESE